MTEITSFESLLKAAAAEPQPQRFLFVFVKTVLPKDADELQTKRFNQGQGGGLTPVMYVDKAQDELTTFDALVEESGYMGAKWDKVIIGCMGGNNGHMPTTEEAEEPLQGLIKTIHTGGDLSRFVTLDYDGRPVDFN